MEAEHGNRREDPATEHARLTAERIAEHLEACAKAHGHLAGERETDLGAPLRLHVDGDGERQATLEPGTADARTVESAEALDAYIRNELCQPLTVRRRGWTVPCERTGTIEPDTARIVIHGETPVAHISGEIAMDGSILEPELEYADADDRMRRLDTRNRPGWRRGIQHVAARFRVALAT